MHTVLSLPLHVLSSSYSDQLGYFYAATVISDLYHATVAISEERESLSLSQSIYKIAKNNPYWGGLGHVLISSQ